MSQVFNQILLFIEKKPKIVIAKVENSFDLIVEKQKNHFRSTELTIQHSLGDELIGKSMQVLGVDKHSSSQFEPPVNKAHETRSTMNLGASTKGKDKPGKPAAIKTQMSKPIGKTGVTSQNASKELSSTQKGLSSKAGVPATKGRPVKK
jgi:hypothetical protein